MPRTVIYATSDRGTRIRAAFDFLLEAAGVPARPAIEGEPADLAHGTASVSVDGIRIPADEGANSWPALVDGLFTAQDVADRMPVDLVSLTANYLDDTVNADSSPSSRDVYGRLKASGAHGHQGGQEAVPVVNRAVALVATLAAERFAVPVVPAWPGGSVAAVALSHDVDMPERYALLRAVARPWRLRRAPRSLSQAALRLARERWSDPAPDDHWAFDELLAMEAAAGVRSTFLFSTTPFHADGGSTLDPAYEANGQRYRQLYRTLIAGGWEIGLHGSYFAYRVPGRLAMERRRLERIAGVEVRGHRHHYWQLGPDPAATLLEHESAGFAYDASLAFNDAPGYRRGVAFPFRPFDRRLDRTIATLQLPTTLMDGNLMYRSMTPQDAASAAIAHVAAIRSLGGLAVIDWHSHTAVPSNRRFRDWGLAYELLLEWLASQPSLWITTLGEVADWWDRRSADIRGAAST